MVDQAEEEGGAVVDPLCTDPIEMSTPHVRTRILSPKRLQRGGSGRSSEIQRAITMEQRAVRVAPMNMTQQRF